LFRTSCCGLLLLHHHTGGLLRAWPQDFLGLKLDARRRPTGSGGPRQRTWPITDGSFRHEAGRQKAPLKRLLQTWPVGRTFFCASGLRRRVAAQRYGNWRSTPRPKLYWKLKPNQDCFTKVDHKPVHVNSHGTRGRNLRRTSRRIRSASCRWAIRGRSAGMTTGNLLGRLKRCCGNTRAARDA